MISPAARAFRAYVVELETALEGAVLAHRDADFAPHLDGAPARALRDLVSVEGRRSRGMFFSSKQIRKQLVDLILPKMPKEGRIMDPACGAGDLLLEAALRIGPGTSYQETLRQWGQRLIGYDLEPEFINATKARLSAAALSLTSVAKGEPIVHWRDSFPNIRVADGLLEVGRLPAATILLNPPFTLREAPPTTAWASGKVSSAAIFVDACVAVAQPGAVLAAVLPEVLRTGTRYGKWRDSISSQTCVRDLLSIGTFDAWTDVDVFLLSLVAGTKERGGGFPANGVSREATVAALFDISVGAVVPHRDPEVGPWRPYICARALPMEGEYIADSRHRRFRGTVFQPPFVVVRRTSRPDQKRRLVANIVTGAKPVAVENHLIVLKPKSGTVACCRRLVRLLDDEATVTHVNNQIRCRHLTVGAVGSIPWVDRV